MAAAEGIDSAASQALGKRISRLSQLDLLVLLVVVWAMVTKPGA